MNNKLAWIPALALGFIIAQPGFADSTATQQPAKNCGGTLHGYKELSGKLNLTDEQKVKIKALKDQLMTNSKASYQQLKALRQQMGMLAGSDTVDEAKLDALISQRNQIKATLIKNRVMMQHQIYTMLTDQQKAQYMAMKKKWAEKQD